MDPKGSHPATKADLETAVSTLQGEMDAMRTELRGETDAMRTELRGEVDAMRTELRGEMGSMEGRLKEFMRDLQTELLRGFEVFSSAQELKPRRQRSDITNLDTETDLQFQLVRKRLLQIEKKLHIDPPPEPEQA